MRSAQVSYGPILLANVGIVTIRAAGSHPANWLRRVEVPREAA